MCTATGVKIGSTVEQIVVAYSLSVCLVLYRLMNARICFTILLTTFYKVDPPVIFLKNSVVTPMISFMSFVDPKKWSLCGNVFIVIEGDARLSIVLFVSA